MQRLIGNLVSLGLKEYEARVYAGLVGIGEGNARQIHEVSGVPRPRVYDVLQSLVDRGFVEVRQGSPLSYRPVEPPIVIGHLNEILEKAVRESNEALESLSLSVHKKFSPIWYVQGDWSIRRNLASVIRDSRDSLYLLVLDPDLPGEYADVLHDCSPEITMKVLVPKDTPVSVKLPRSEVYSIGEFCPLFREEIFGKIFSSEVRKEGSVFRLDGIVLSDDRDLMIIYRMNGERMAVIVTLPFITAVQSLFFERMCRSAERINPGKNQEE
ncbi:MAG: TrmB family transcriptional regulator [Methanolinea sp.]|jgi:sugar-specific transcriptional regulator TrmB|nr:TrmB family transcriptional regulator [Methanolinea sp.]